MRVIPFGPSGAPEASVARAVRQLRERRLIAYPTETVYGLGSALDGESLERLAALKGRDPARPFLLLVAGLDMITALGLNLPSPAARLALAFWPGPLTLVLENDGTILSPWLRGPAGGVAVRWTSHAGAQRVIRAFGSAITSTSANQSGLPSATTALEIATEWSGQVASGELLVLDGGVLAGGAPSTVVDCLGGRPCVSRPGAVSVDRLRETVPDLVGEC